MSNLQEIRPAEPNPFLIKALESLLERAKTGELQGYVGLFMFNNQTVDEAWIETPKWWHTEISCDRAVGALERLKHKLLAIRVSDEVDRYVYVTDDPDDTA